jgi:hypothetical protein
LSAATTRRNPAFAESNTQARVEASSFQPVVLPAIAIACVQNRRFFFPADNLASATAEWLSVAARAMRQDDSRNLFSADDGGVGQHVKVISALRDDLPLLSA